MMFVPSLRADPREHAVPGEVVEGGVDLVDDEHRARASAIAASSRSVASSVRTPVGLCRFVTTIARVRGVIDAATRAGAMRKPSADSRRNLRTRPRPRPSAARSSGS